MFNMGFSELIIFAVIALIFIGPKQLPEIARVIGRTLNEFKRATGDLTKPVNDFKKQAQEELNNVSEQVKIDELDIKIEKEFDKLRVRMQQGEDLNVTFDEVASKITDQHKKELAESKKDDADES